MEYPKRSQSSYFNDCNDIKRKRLNMITTDSNNSLTKSIIHFEDLSNEIIYEIFGFLDFRHTYDAFSNLNKRFQNFLTNLTLPLNIYMSSMSKSDFQNPIEHLIINNEFDIDKLAVLSSYIPQLRRLSFGNLFHCSNEQIISCPIKLNHLIYASLNMNNINFDQFEILIKHLFFQLQVLYIKATNDKTYLDPNGWEKLILSYMPYLRIFDIQWEYFPQKNVNTTDIFMIESFRTQFWLERQWFFIFT
ncbi:unnamed protein product, partial [Rotaria magnacalcarata]